jgi:ribosomal protein S18 acetylase RimI-like enzyme
MPDDPRAAAPAIAIRAFETADEDQVVQLWHDCGLIVPWNDPHQDIRRKGSEHPELFLVATGGGRIVGAAMAGYDGHRGTVFYLAVAPERQGQGIGRLLMTAVEQRLAALGCPKLNVQVRAGNAQVVGFYRKLGYRVEELINLGRWLAED